MNRATLAELQRQRCYPSITMLLNTTPGVELTSAEHNTARLLLQQVDDRLDGDVSDALRRSLTDRLAAIVDEHAAELSTQSLAVFVSPAYSAAVRLANAVEERVTIDDTFTTRDLIADLTRTAAYSVFTISERIARRFVGDRRRLVEVHDSPWPLVRDGDQSLAAWTRTLDAHLRAERGADPLPTVIAGVHRSIRQLAPGLTDQIGVIPGNHDRSTAEELRLAAWPLVDGWLTADAIRRALDHLDEAVSTRRYAEGIHEVWALGHDGRIATLVVESGYTLPARIDENNQLHPADDAEHPDVNDDVVDDVMEVVLLRGGSIVVVDDGVLHDHQRIAAVLRY
jgi:hypothetical protein